MTICPNDSARCCNIWLSREEGRAYHNAPDFQAAYRKYHDRMGYRVCVYVGGSEPLLPNVTALLDYQRQEI